MQLALGTSPVPLDSARLAALGVASQPGTRWCALPPDSAHPEAILLQNGTEVARIDSARWNRTIGNHDSNGFVPGPSWNDLRRWTRPPEGIEASWTFRRSRSSHSSPLDRNQFEATWDQPWKDWGSLGLAAGIERTSTAFPLDSISGSPGGTWWPWWGGRVCARSACWEFRTSQHPIPAVLWTQEKMDSLAVDRGNGALSTSWDAEPPPTALNWQNSLALRLGALDWRTTVDADRWKGAEHEMTLTAPAGGTLRWGLLVGTNSSRAWTGAILGFAPRSFDLPRGMSLESSPATLVLRFASINCFALEVRTSLRVLPPWRLP